MSRFVFGLGLLAWFSPCWAQVAPGSAATLDLLHFQSAPPDDATGKNRHPQTRFTASLVLLNAPDVPRNVQIFSAAPGIDQGPPAKDKDWNNAGFARYLTGGDRGSLAPRLRMDAGPGRLELTPRKHSLWVEWKASLPP